MSTLRKNYNKKRLQQESRLHEAIADMFSSDSENVKKVTDALARAKYVANTYKMKNISAAVASAEQQFQNSIASKKTDPATNPVISNILTFSDIISEFFNQMDQWVSQLPTVAQALQAADQPGNEQKTLKELLGNQANTIVSIVQKQFDKSSGGFWKGVGRLLKTGRVMNASAALKAFNLDAQRATDDVLGVNAQQYKTLLQAGKQVVTPAITQAPANAENPQSGSDKTTASVPGQASQGPQAATTTAPPTQGQQSGGNAQAAAKPTPEQAKQRVQSLGSLKNRQAFVPEILGSLSNEEIKADMDQIAKQLGIK